MSNIRSISKPPFSHLPKHAVTLHHFLHSPNPDENMAATTTTTTSGLTPEQSAALFDILTHRESYDEIEAFKQPNTIHQYGPPFQDSVTTKSRAPILQTLLSKFILTLPGLCNVPPSFWKTQIADLINELSQAQLSESYDKGLLGIRKTFATAISALIEYPTRACLGGFPKTSDTQTDQQRKYDTSDPEDVLQAWQDCLQAIVYGDLIDKMFAKAAETDDLTKHETLVQGMHEFVLVK